MDNTAQNPVLPEKNTETSRPDTISTEEQNNRTNTLDALKTSTAQDDDNKISENKNNVLGSNDAKPTSSQVQRLDDKVKSVKLPQELKDKVTAMIDRLRLIQNDSSFFIEFDSTSRYIDWVVGIPWENSSEDILNLAHVKEVLDKNHYGLADVKGKILEFLAMMIMKKEKTKGDINSFARAPIIALVGLAGVGKTSVAFSIADAIGRKIVRIPFGGMGGASHLRGKTRLFPDAEPGLVIKALTRGGTKNPVILLDEIDRVSDDARSDVMGVLVELLDPEQNSAFTDHFIDFPVDLSNVLFITTSNNTNNISNAVIDRMELIQLPSYSDDEKTSIAKTFVLPKSLSDAGLTDADFAIEDDVWESFIIRPLGYDPGIRSLQRVINGVVRKVVFNMLTGVVPRNTKFVLTTHNVKEYVAQW